MKSRKRINETGEAKWPMGEDSQTNRWRRKKNKFETEKRKRTIWEKLKIAVQK